MSNPKPPKEGQGGAEDLKEKFDRGTQPVKVIKEPYPEHSQGTKESQH